MMAKTKPKQDIYSLITMATTKAEIQTIESYNEKTARYGLMLSKDDINELIESKYEIMKETGRVELNNDVLSTLIYEFCDSPYINQDEYKETLVYLQDLFYNIKSECVDPNTKEDLVADDDLIKYMAKQFNNRCGGDLEELSSVCFEKYYYM